MTAADIVVETSTNSIAAEIFNQLLSKKLFYIHRCINVIVKPQVLEIYKSHLSLIPVNIKNALLKVLFKRGSINDANALKQLVNSKVKEVDLSECDVTDDLLSCLNVCQNLEKLDLSLRRRQKRRITTDVLNSLFINLPNLKILAIPHCKEVNDEVIKTVCENCTQLRELHIPNSSITDLSLNYIGKNLCHLSVINVLGTQISDTGMQYLLSGPLSRNLTEINIDKCPNLSSYSSAIVAEKCTNIKIFSCGSCGSNEDLVLAMDGIRTKAKQIFWNV